MQLQLIIILQQLPHKNKHDSILFNTSVSGLVAMIKTTWKSPSKSFIPFKKQQIQTTTTTTTTTTNGSSNIQQNVNQFC